VAELRAGLGDALPGYMIPSGWMMLEALPLTENGKVDRAALPPLVSGTGPEELDARPPADDVERRLIEIWQTTLAVDRVTPTDDFFELGGHSLLAVTLFSKIEKAFGVALPLATLFQAPRVEDQASLIRQGGVTTVPRSVVTIQAHGHRYPIFAVPGVGGHVIALHDLVRHLGDEQPFYGLQPVGLQGEAEPMARVEEIAAHFVREVRTIQPEGPYHLLGVCMGGAVAYEMAQQLVAAGQRVPMLAMLETWRPLAWHGITTLHLRRASVFRFALRRLFMYARIIWDLEPAERGEYIRARLATLRRAVALRDPFSGDRSELYRARVAEANLRAFRTYMPRPYPGRILVFCAEGRRALAALDRRLAWRDLVTGMEVYTVPGNDSGLMLVEPHVRVLAEQLRAHLSMDAAASGHRP
jgi:thioesterase domain-containing protein/acyl carrier protein